MTMDSRARAHTVRSSVVNTPTAHLIASASVTLHASSRIKRKFAAISSCQYTHKRAVRNIDDVSTTNKLWSAYRWQARFAVFRVHVEPVQLTTTHHNNVTRIRVTLHRVTLRIYTRTPIYQQHNTTSCNQQYRTRERMKGGHTHTRTRYACSMEQHAVL